jgi:hypothetical protein
LHLLLQSLALLEQLLHLKIKIWSCDWMYVSCVFRVSLHWLFVVQEQEAIEKGKRFVKKWSLKGAYPVFIKRKYICSVT